MNRGKEKPMANEPKLKPCKVCGCNYIRVWERHRSSGNTFHCECEKCKTKTDDVFSKEVAVDEWNKTNETPMPNVNEPTTEEIVRRLRYCGNEKSSCVECAYTGIDKNGECFQQLSNDAADRLESQEREIADKGVLLSAAERLLEASNAEYARLYETINTLTARAESAERERDAAMSFMAAVQSIMSDILLDNIPQRPAITEWIRNSIAIWNTYLRGKSQEGGGK